MVLDSSSETLLRPPVRDTVQGVVAECEQPPAIVSVSDIHGYLDSARAALLTLRDHRSVEPVVVADDDGTLHWADENYVLVFNGDLVDRGPANEEVMALVQRLIAESPPGRVRVVLGNHEAMMLSPKQLQFGSWYSVTVGPEERETFLDAIRDGYVVAAYEGYNHTYAHAGSPDPYDVAAVNDSLREAASKLRHAAGTIDDGAVQRRVIADHPTVLGTGDRHLKGTGAGLVWLDFSHLPPDAPPQVVGHTRHADPQQKGNVFCQDVILDNRGSDGGETVFLETPRELRALTRDSGTQVTATTLTES